MGFIRRLPHHLVESFKATLQEVREADLLVHVVDASSDDPEHQIRAVDEVLDSVAPGERRTLMVFNKLDLADAEGVRNRFARAYPDAVFLSALDPAGVDRLKGALTAQVMREETIMTVTVPLDRLQLLGRLHRTGSVLEQEYTPEHCVATVRVNTEERNRLLAEPGVEPVNPPAGD